MHFIKRAAARALAAPASTFVRAAPRSFTPFAICNQTAVISAFRRYNSTEDSPIEPVSTDASEQSSVRSAVSSATQSMSSGFQNAREFAPETRRGEQPHDVSPNKSIYVGNLNFGVTPEELELAFAPYGEIASVRIAQDARGLSKGFAYVEYKGIESATKAIKERNSTDFEGRRMVVNYMAQTRNSRPPINPPSQTLFIGNLAFEMTDADLNELFRDVPNVIDVRVAIDRRTGQPRGFAHADFVDVDSAVKAMEFLAGKEVYNRRLRIDYSTTTRSPTSHGGRGERTRSNF